MKSRFSLFSFFSAVFASFASKANDLLFGYLARVGGVLAAVQLPNGSIIQIASGYGDVTDLDSLSNANPAIGVVSASHAFTTGDYLEVTSGWSRLTDKVVRAQLVAGNSVTFEGIDTSSTTIYPVGSGVGTVREITGWTQLAQILSSGTSGGEQQFLEYQFLESDAQRRIPTVKSASGMEFSIADDPSLAGYILASAANDDRLPRAIRITLPSGAKILYNAYITLNKIPSLGVNELMAVQATLSLLAEPVRYSS